MRILLVLTILINSAIGFSQSAELSFMDATQRLKGKVQEGKTVTFEYDFENRGEVPLTFSKYEVSCPCTKVSLPTDPIMPGSDGQVIVTFDTKDKIGWQDRKIKIYSNASNGVEEIRFKLMVDNK